MSAKQKSHAPGQILNLYQENFFEAAFPLQTGKLLLELRPPKEQKLAQICEKTQHENRSINFGFYLSIHR